MVWSPFFKELEILQAEKNEKLDRWGVVPLLAYQNKRTLRVVTWWKSVNWEDAAKRFKDIVEA